MSNNFDPYHVWLGIPPVDQPPNHYRLLGLQLFESAQDVIDHAGDRQMAHLRSFQIGRHGHLSQQLLNEVAAARCCLLDSAQKSKYDEGLRTLQKLGNESNGLNIEKSPTVSKNRTKQKNPFRETAKLLAGGLVGMAIAAVLLKVVAGVDVRGFFRTSSVAKKEPEEIKTSEANKNGRSEIPPQSSPRPSTTEGREKADKTILGNSTVREHLPTTERPQTEPMANKPPPLPEDATVVSPPTSGPKTTPEISTDKGSVPEATPATAKATNVTEVELTVTESVGVSGQGTQFRAIAPDGAVVVGFAVTFGKFGRNFANSSIGSLQPIYAAGNKKELGPVVGAPGQSGLRITAKPGFAVAAMRVNADTRILGLQVIYAPVKDGKLTRSRTYASEWIGTPSKDAPKIATGDRATIGIAGWSAKESIRSLSLITRTDQSSNAGKVKDSD